MEPIYPFIVLAVGLVIVIGGIVVLRVNAFLALITAAIVVSLMAPGAWALKISRVAEAFGSTAASIGIVIALAAVIGRAMLDSGAADRIVRSFLELLGEKRAGTAMAGSGFALSIPVFFDTAFYLLVPLARSMARRTDRHYLKYLVAIVAGAATTHALVSPTPGPLFVANRLGVDLGMMILIGLIVGLPAAVTGLLFARWIDARMPIEMRPLSETAAEPLPDERLPGLLVSLLPILLPIALIATNSVVKVMAQSAIVDAPIREPALTEAILAASGRGVGIAQWFQWTNIAGNPNLALLLSAAIAVTTLYYQRRPSREEMAATTESALMSGGVIILITAAGGAFGAMLKAAQLGEAVQAVFGATATTGIALLIFAFLIASLVKFAQGSSTAAMIVTSGMVAAMITPRIANVSSGLSRYGDRRRLLGRFLDERLWILDLCQDGRVDGIGIAQVVDARAGDPRDDVDDRHPDPGPRHADAASIGTLCAFGAPLPATQAIQQGSSYQETLGKP